MTKRIDLDRAVELWARWRSKAEMWSLEGSKLRHLAKTGPAKYYATRMSEARDAEKEATKYRHLIAELDGILEGIPDES